MRLRSVTAFFPAYNDGGTIGSMVILAVQTLPKVTDDFEVIIVNDGSRDHTADVAAELARLYPQVRLVQHDRNHGYGAALRSGFAHATKDWIFYTDGDAQYDPRELVNLAAAARDDIDIINGYKVVRHDPFYRVVIGQLYHYIVSAAFGLRLRDVDCDFRLIRRSVFDRVRLDSVSGVICVEMVKKFQDAGCRFVEVPVRHYHRSYGPSQFFRFGRLCRVAIHLVRLWWRLVVRRGQREQGLSRPVAESRNA
ncbi:MAG TPA: glycosyltransferase family 2 protein [Verrucomicrobiae bacterium]|nr:glycosyltransferase family 2 protein [Verrucomicrobiae bacterium]